jgi:hypothetical protein
VDEVVSREGESEEEECPEVEVVPDGVDSATPTSADGRMSEVIGDIGVLLYLVECLCRDLRTVLKRVRSRLR